MGPVGSIRSFLDRLSVWASADSSVLGWRRRLWALANLPALSSAFVRRRRARNTTFIAISGSRGKTTAKELLGRILTHRHATQITKGNSNGRFGVTRTLRSIRRDTRFAIVEIGIDAPGLMWRASWLVRPDIAVITVVAAEHTENYLSLAAIANEKGRLIAGLSAKGVAVLNADDPHVAAMARRLRRGWSRTAGQSRRTFAQMRSNARGRRG